MANVNLVAGRTLQVQISQKKLDIEKLMVE